MLLNWNIRSDKSEILDSEELKAGKNHIVVSLPHDSELKRVHSTVSVEINPDEKIFMNGYQTWTVSPEYSIHDRIRGIHKIPKKLIDVYSFDRYGDYHFVNYPYKKGITHGFSWCYFRKGNNYRLFASLDETPGYTMFQYDAGRQVLSIDRDCEGLHVSGKYHAFDLFYAEGNEQEVFDAWFDALNIHPPVTEKLYGYSSWYNRYQDINEASIGEDLQGCTKLFEKGDLFQIDDGWEPYVGDWLEADHTKFPSGMKAVADKIHKAGFKAGLWLAPFVAEEKSQLYQNHQDWFLKVNGDNWKLGCNWSGFYSLDIDNPEVIDYVKKSLKRVHDEWGFDLVKLDFLYGAAPFGNRHETRARRMLRAMKMIREDCGDMQILGCGVPVMPAFGYVDYCRISCDVSLDWDDVWYMHSFHRERTSTRNAITNIVTRRELNGRAYGSDPDVFFLRDNNIKLNDRQKDDLAMLDALLGNVFLTSDNPGSYTSKMTARYEYYRRMSHAKVLHVSVHDGIHITYELNGRKNTCHLFER
ncbi:MAG: alpha-galactosidase [Erysipelotrichaceae bacterium]|nr:alpha-galactosidase [Erysipelotrichaceae bacterium]